MTTRSRNLLAEVRHEIENVRYRGHQIKPDLTWRTMAALLEVLEEVVGVPPTTYEDKCVRLRTGGCGHSVPCEMCRVVARQPNSEDREV